MIVDNFYPRSPCGERRLPLRPRAQRDRISIHALLAESDLEAVAMVRWTLPISIHALLAESDCRQLPRRPGYRHFYPRSPCGERLGTTRIRRRICNFYPRSPCGERHTSSRKRSGTPSNFYPRSPCGERPSSRHTLQSPSNFYPRSPCGERPLAHFSGIGSSSFLSTLSLRRATLSPIALLMISRFLSTLSLRRATHLFILAVRQNIISIHALLAESDQILLGAVR